jgi:protoporphyrinogen oxidase
VDVCAIAKRGDGWDLRFADGSVRRYPTLVSTIPIFELVSLLEGGVPDTVRTAIEGLRYNALRVLLVGVKKLLRPGYATVYVADPESPAHRYCFSDGFSSRLAPDDCASIFAEVTHDPRVGPASTDSELTERTIAWLTRERFIDGSDVIVTDVRTIEYAYPVYDLAYKKNVAIVHEYFERLGLHLLGRFAQFLYINSDVCIKNARTLARRLRAG